MNFENLARVRDAAEQHGVENGLYCDGHLLCLSGPLAMEEWRFNQRAHELWEKKKAEADTGILLSPGQMRGGFPLYVRYLHAEELTVAIMERFRRCFNETATFHGTHKEKQVLVFEDGALVGIVMPVATWKDPDPIDNQQVIPFVDDDAVFHHCDCGEV